MMTVRRFMLVLAMLGLCGTPAAWAQDASDWDTQNHAAARLLAGAAIKTTDASFVRAGIEIRIDPGWKTYWHDPGDSGAPPTFDFSGSDNVKSVSILWPAPERFSDGAGGHSIGYVDHVILPLQVTPQDAAKPSELDLKLGYAICGNLCVPVEANLKLPLNGNGAEDGTIEQAQANVPRRVPLGPGKGLAILSVHREDAQPHPRVIVDVAAPAGAPVDLFVEGPTSDWSLPLPEPMPGGADGTTRKFSFDLDGLPPDAKPEGAALTFTAVSHDDAIEVLTHLD